jgi:hypothetical protein
MTKHDLDCQCDGPYGCQRKPRIATDNMCGKCTKPIDDHDQAGGSLQACPMPKKEETGA